MYDTVKTNGEKTSKNENVTATKQSKHLPAMKKRLSTRVSTAFSIQTHCRNPRQILHRLMYNTVKTNGEKTSNEEKWRTETSAVTYQFRTENYCLLGDASSYANSDIVFLSSVQFLTS